MSAVDVQALDPQRHLTQYKHDVWTMEQGLPLDHITSIAQTPDGYLWIGTEAGLARFDGVKFQVFNQRNTPALKDNYISRLHVDRQGRLWISVAKGLCYLEKGRFTLWQEGAPQAQQSVALLHEEPDGSLWISTRDELLHYFPDGHFNAYTTANGLPSNVINDVHRDRQGQVWVAGMGGVMKLLADGHLQKCEEIPGKSVRVIFESRDGTLWFGSDSGLSQLRDGQLRTYGLREGLPSELISSIAEDRDGNLWIGAFHNGLTRFDGKRFSVLTSREGFEGTYLKTIFEDREGSLWVATVSSGLNRFCDTSAIAWTEKEGLSHKDVTAVYEAPDGTVWIGTRNGGINSLSAGKITTHVLKGGGRSITAFLQDRNGSLWIGTAHDGIARLRAGRFEKFAAGQSFRAYVTALLEDQQGSIRAASDVGLHEYKNGGFMTQTLSARQDENYTNTMLEASNGGLWLGLRHSGVAFLSGGQTQRFTTETGLSSNAIYALYADQEGALWIGTSRAGINRLKDGRVTVWTSRDGLPDDKIYHLLEDDQGFLWASCTRGIFRVSKRQLEDQARGLIPVVTPRLLDTADGLPSRDCNGGVRNAGWKGRDGRLWFTTTRGLVEIHPDRLRNNSLLPPVHIESVVAAGKTTFPWEGREMTLAAGTSRIDVNFVGLSYLNPGKMQFRYRLEGFDADWIEAGNERVAHYTNLSPGRYRFRVMAANNDGVWNETGSSADLLLRPFFYQTTWFAILCALLGAALLWMLYQYRIRQIQARHQAVLNERSRIAREMHDTLIQGVVGVSGFLEAVTVESQALSQRSRNYLERARQQLDSSLDEARATIRHLRQPGMAERNLAAELAEQVHQITAGTPIHVEMEVQGTATPLSGEVHQQLRRICQEAVSNAVRHAGATLIQIRLQYETAQVRMTVTDDGHGFDDAVVPASDGMHFGLVGMRERAEIIGGVCVIDGRPGQGTQIEIVLPTAP